MNIRWEDPTETANIIGSGQKPGRYLEFAVALREYPGRWAVLPSESSSDKGANATAQNIRRGKVKGFTPAGAYETAVEGTKIWVRFKENQPPTPAPDADDDDDEKKPDPALVRAWAKDQGIRVSDKGALPKHVFDRYAEALARGEVGLGLRAVPND